MLRTLILLCASQVSTSALGAILIESVDDEGKQGRVLIDEGRARIDAGSLGGYMLINLEDGSAFAINHGERAILDLRSPLVTTDPHNNDHAHASTPSPAVTFKKIGKGPLIAGFQTTHYRVSINGLHCSDEYLSQQLLALPNVKRFIEVISESTGADSSTGMDVPFDVEAPCESADELVDDYYPELGIPMRTVDSNGLVSHEITRVDTEIDPPAGTFTSPPGYKKVTRSELIERSARHLSGHPDMGNLKIEEIKKMQQQIKEQIEMLKKSRRQDSAPEDDINIDVAPINK